MNSNIDRRIITKTTRNGFQLCSKMLGPRLWFFENSVWFVLIKLNKQCFFTIGYVFHLPLHHKKILLTSGSHFAMFKKKLARPYISFSTSFCSHIFDPNDFYAIFVFLGSEILLFYRKQWIRKILWQMLFIISILNINSTLNTVQVSWKFLRLPRYPIWYIFSG